MTLDHLEARAWADHHRDISAFVSDMIAALRQTFEVLVAVTYAAPWKREDR